MLLYTEEEEEEGKNNAKSEITFNFIQCLYPNVIVDITRSGMEL